MWCPLLLRFFTHFFSDNQCDPGVGVDRFFHAIYTQPSTRMVMLLGSACSEVTESLAKVVPYWNIVQVSHLRLIKMQIIQLARFIQPTPRIGQFLKNLINSRA